MIDVFIIDINKSIEDNYKKSYFEMLDKYEIIRYNRIQGVRDKEKFLFSRYLLKKILSIYTNQKITDIKFEYNHFGKPLLPNSILNFNLSHSENYLAISISDKEIGVDIENVKSIDLDMAEIFCTDRELLYIYNGANQYYNFFRLWTLKEAFVKNIGTGLCFNVKNLDFNLDKLPAVQFRVNNHLFKTVNFFTKNINSDILSVCHRKTHEEPNIIRFNNIEQINCIKL